MTKQPSAWEQKQAELRRVSALERKPDVGHPVLLGAPDWPRAVIGTWKGGGDNEWRGFLDESEELPIGDPTYWMELPSVKALPSGGAS